LLTLAQIQKPIQLKNLLIVNLSKQSKLVRILNSSLINPESISENVFPKSSVSSEPESLVRLLSMRRERRTIQFKVQIL